MLADAADVEYCGLMLLAMLLLNGVMKRCFGSNRLMLSFDTFLFMLLPCFWLSSPPPTLISASYSHLEAWWMLLGLPKPQNKKCSEMVDFLLNPLLKKSSLEGYPTLAPYTPN